MNPREISARLHDILGTACRVRQPGPGRPVDAALVGIDEVKAGLRDLIRDLGGGAPTPPPPRPASADVFPEGPVAGTRARVQHRRRGGRSAIDPGQRGRRPLPDPAEPRRSESSLQRRAAEAEFATLTSRPAAL